MAAGLDPGRSGAFRVLTIMGTRPEAIKLAPVLQALAGEAPLIESRLAVTAQHRQMLDAVLEVFALVPDHDLDLMRPGQDLYDVTAAGLLGLRDVLRRVRPDLVLVQGDTTTTFAGALAAFYQKIPVGHVEAGLRTRDRHHPFPEEVNRTLVTHLADVHFAPTESARRNLLAEGVDPAAILVTGNPGIDALLQVAARTDGPRPPVLDSIPAGERVILVTAHRRESFGEPFERMVGAMARIASDHPGVHLVYPVHLNPNVRGPVERVLGNHPRIHLIEPVGYLAFVSLMKRAFLILTDSGGIQEEAPSLGVPVLVMRETTERPEGVEAGTVRLVGTREEAILEGVRELLEDTASHERMARTGNPYGDGHAAGRIAGWIRQRALARGSTDLEEPGRGSSRRRIGWRGGSMS